MNIYSFLSEHFSNGVAFETVDGRTWTYDDIEQGSAKVANWISSNNLPKGSVIAVKVSKTVENIILYFGIIRAGMIYFPLNPSYPDSEVQRFLDDSKAELYLEYSDSIWKDCPSTFETVEAYDTDPAVLLYTSGTTGSYKGAVLSHGGIRENMVAFDKVLDWQPTDRLLHCLPIFHAHGLLIATHAMMYNGSSCIWIENFNPKVCVQALPKVTLVMAVPTMYHRMSKFINKDLARNIKAFISASAPLPSSVAEHFYQKSRKEIVERYGTTESLVITSNPINAVKRGTVGKPIPGMNIRINQQEEIEIQGPGLFLGYRGFEDTTDHLTDDGWFNTGDQGKIDEDGYLTIFGRTKDIIIHKGFKVIPTEVESIIERCNGVKEVAVIGLPDRDAGETVHAVVVTKDGFNIEEVKEKLINELVQYKRPKELMAVESLPKTPLGKIQKNKLRSDITNGITQGDIYDI